MFVQHVEGCAALSGLVQFDGMVKGTDRLRIYRPGLQAVQKCQGGSRPLEQKPGDGREEKTYGKDEIEEVDTREPGHHLQENVAPESLQRHQHLVAG